MIKNPALWLDGAIEMEEEEEKEDEAKELGGRKEGGLFENEENLFL